MGNIRWAADTFYTANVEDRDLNREMSDPGRRAFFMERVAEAQRREHYRVERQLAGMEYGEGRGTYRGVVEYQQEVERLRSWEDQYAYPNATVVVRDHEIADMSLGQYDAAFDANGRPLPHVFYHPNRSIRLNDQVDSDSVRELGGNR